MPGSASGTVGYGIDHTNPSQRGPYPRIEDFAHEPEAQQATGVAVPAWLHTRVRTEARKRAVAHVDVVLDAVASSAGEVMDDLLIRQRETRTVDGGVFGRRVRSDRRHQQVARRLGIRPTHREWAMLHAIAEWHGVAVTELVTLALGEWFRPSSASSASGPEGNQN